jgi:hypothetical protein
LDLPKPPEGRSMNVPDMGSEGGNRVPDQTYFKWMQWQTERLKELWFLWDGEIRKINSSARFIPNGFPDRVLTGKHSDFFFADQQGNKFRLQKAGKSRFGANHPMNNPFGSWRLRPIT